MGEGDPAVAGLLQTILEEESYEVVVACTGPEVVASAIVEPPDLVILEGMLPELDGWSVCEILGNLPGHGRIPIVFLSTQTLTESYERAKESGAACYVTKPFDVPALIQLVDGLSCRDRMPGRGRASPRSSPAPRARHARGPERKRKAS